MKDLPTPANDNSPISPADRQTIADQVAALVHALEVAKTSNASDQVSR